MKEDQRIALHQATQLKFNTAEEQASEHTLLYTSSLLERVFIGKSKCISIKQHIMHIEVF